MDKGTTMPAVDRATAEKLNPLIGLFPSDTLDNCASLIRMIGHAISVAEGEQSEVRLTEHLYLITSAIGAALDYESEFSESASTESPKA